MHLKFSVKISIKRVGNIFLSNNFSLRIGKKLSQLSETKACLPKIML